MNDGDYEVLAVRYAGREVRGSEVFHRFPVYGEPDEVFGMSFYYWVVRDGGTTILVDTGFHPSAAAKRGRTFDIAPLEALGRLGIDPGDVSKICVTHMHYDHIGNLRAFPNAELLVDQSELEFWTGSYAQRPLFASSVERDEIEYVAQAKRDGRITLLGADTTVAPGIRSIRVGGHTPGQHVVRIAGAGGPVVLASDSMHFYRELERDWPFGVISDLAGMYRAYEALRELGQDPDTTIVAGHDEAVFERFPRVSGPGEQIAVRCSSG